MTRMTATEFYKAFPGAKRKGKPVKSARKPKTPAKRPHKRPPLRLREMHEHWYRAPVEPPKESGPCVHRFFLPISLCQRQDARLKVIGWKAAKMKRDVTGYLRMQCHPLEKPLEGRPLVRCIRFSSVEPDKYADWAKLAVDCLCAPNKRSPNRLNIIKDDAPKFAEIEQIWRKAKPGEGFVVIEVWTGWES
jgi:hypothetical protein